MKGNVTFNKACLMPGILRDGDFCAAAIVEKFQASLDWALSKLI